MRERRSKHGILASAVALAAGLCAAMFSGCVSAPPPNPDPGPPPPAPKAAQGPSEAPAAIEAMTFDAPSEGSLESTEAMLLRVERFAMADRLGLTNATFSITRAPVAMRDAEPRITTGNGPPPPGGEKAPQDAAKDKKFGTPEAAPGEPDADGIPATPAQDPAASRGPDGPWGGGRTPGRPGAGGGGGGPAEPGKEAGSGKPGGAERDGAGVKAPSQPTGPAVGRPAGGVTREERRDQVDAPLRVGKDDAEVEQARRRGVDAELARDPTPRFDEELWVIQRPARAAVGRRGPEAPRSGALMLREAPRGAERAAVLRETAARAAIAGPVSRVTLSQRFENPSRAAVDGVYVLPLPREAAITDFVMTVGSRKIRGVIRERAEAEKIFLDARRAGKIVSLVGEDAPNLFVQKIGNLASGASLDVSITYFSTLEYSAGAYELVLPLTATTQYQGAAAISSEVRDGHGVSVEVQVDAGAPIRGLTCTTHEVDATPLSPREARVVLRPADTLPNRDLVLRILVADAQAPTAGVLPQTDQSGTYFSVVIVPPLGDAAGSGRGPIELVLIPDFASATTPEQAARLQRAAARLVSRLTERDRVLVVTDPASAGVPTAAGPAAVAAAGRASGVGAPLSGLLRAALDLPAPTGDRVLCVLSRGEPADGVGLLRDARAKLGPARLFAVSIDGPAGLTLEGLARIGRGGVISLGAGPTGLEAPLDALIDDVSRPVLSALSIDWGGAEVVDVFPRRLPDLCAGRPVHLVGRMISPPKDGAAIRVVGVAHGPSGPRLEELRLPWRDASGVPGAVHTLWARAKVLSLAEGLGHDASGDAELRRSIVATALAHNLVSPFTSFVSVDAMSDVPAGTPLQANREAAATNR